MKTNIINTILISMAILTGCACNNNVEAKNKKSDIIEVMSGFNGIDNVEYLDINGPLLSFGKVFAGKEDGDNIAKGIKRICILEAEDAPEMTRDSIIRELSSALENYEILISAKDDADNVDIYTKFDGDHIRELVIFVKNDATIIAVTGKIALDKVSEIIEDIR